MPIRDLPRRLTELGRIRLGQKTTYANGKTGPAKLDRFRFTTGHLRLAETIAARYGGQVQTWEGSGRGQLEVYTDARSVPVLVVAGGLSQWMEAWTAAGCARRCDGVTELRSGPDPVPCLCKVTGDSLCRPTTRLSVMLRDVEVLGAWRLETHGWNAAAELPAMAEIAARFGPYVPAHLELVDRVAVTDGTTARYVVPVLRLDVGPDRLAALTATQPPTTPALAAGADPDTPALASADRLDSGDDAGLWAQLVDAATTLAECRQIWQQAADAGQLTDKLRESVTTRAHQLDQDQPPPVAQDLPDPSPTAQDDTSPPGAAAEDVTSPTAQDDTSPQGAAAEDDTSPAAQVDDPQLVHAGDDETLTRPLLKALQSAYGGRGVTVRADRLAHASGELGFAVTSFSTLTRAHAHHLLRALERPAPPGRQDPTLTLDPGSSPTPPTDGRTPA